MSQTIQKIYDRLITRADFEDSLFDILRITENKDLRVKVIWVDDEEFDDIHDEIQILTEDGKIFRKINTKGNSFLASYRDFLSNIM